MTEVKKELKNRVETYHSKRLETNNERHSLLIGKKIPSKVRKLLKIFDQLTADFPPSSREEYYLNLANIVFLKNQIVYELNKKD